LSASRGENLVGRANTRLRAALYSQSYEERIESAYGLLRDQETLREMVLAQELRARKVSRLAPTSKKDSVKKQMESALRDKTEAFEKLSAKLPKGVQSTESKEILLPVPNCESQLAHLGLKETMVDRELFEQSQDLNKFKDLAREAIKCLEDSKEIYC